MLAPNRKLARRGCGTFFDRWFLVVCPSSAPKFLENKNSKFKMVTFKLELVLHNFKLERQKSKHPKFKVFSSLKETPLNHLLL